MNLEDVNNLTYPQYGEIISAISRKIGWDIHLSVLPQSGELDDELIPLYSPAVESEDRVFRLTDALALQGVAKGQKGTVD